MRICNSVLNLLCELSCRPFRKKQKKIIDSKKTTNKTTRDIIQNQQVIDTVTEEEKIKMAKVEEENAEKIEELNYINKAKKINSNTTEVSFYMAEFITQKPNFIYWNEAEMLYIAQILVVLQNSYTEASKLIPPKKFETYHKLFLSALKKYSEATPLIAEGIDNFNNTKISKASKLLSEGAKLMEQSTQELNKQIKQFDNY